MTLIFINRRVHAFIAYALLLGVFLGSTLPIPVPDTQYVSHSDKLIHAFAYAILGLWFAQITPANKLVGLLLALFSYGVLIELFQTVLPYRMGSWLDLGANSAGLVIAMFCTNFVKNRAEG